VNTWEEKTLADIIYGFGEEKYSRKIAKAIIDARKKKPIKTTFDLVKIIDEAVGRSYKRMKNPSGNKDFPSPSHSNEQRTRKSGKSYRKRI